MLFISRDLSFVLMHAFILLKLYAYLMFLMIISISKSYCSEFSRYPNDFPANSAAIKKCVCNPPLTTSLILEKAFLKKI